MARMDFKTKLLPLLKQVFSHLVFWLSVLFFFTAVFGVNNNMDRDTLYFSMFLMPVTIGTTYTSIYKLIPEYLLLKRYYRFTVYSMYTLIISTFGILFSIFIAYAYFTNIEDNTLNSIGKSSLFIISCIFLIVVVVSGFKLLQFNLLQSKKNAKLEAQILEAKLKLKEQELNHLKMQIHPHFLFNTLNTMYGFALQKAEETPDMILKLSNLLDYLLYQVDKPFVSLTDEIHHIEDYISLENIRFNDTLAVNFDKDITSDTIEIAPMLLIPFVENSFKHGTMKNGRLEITIKLKGNPKSVYFKIENSCRKEEHATNGIGLENIKKRLDITYPNAHKLNIASLEDSFSVELFLNLTSELKND